MRAERHEASERRCDGGQPEAKQERASAAERHMPCPTHCLTRCRRIRYHGAMTPGESPCSCSPLLGRVAARCL